MCPKMRQMEVVCINMRLNDEPKLIWNWTVEFIKCILVRILHLNLMTHVPTPHVSAFPTQSPSLHSTPPLTPLTLFLSTKRKAKNN